MSMDWHRIFCMGVADSLTGTPFQIIQELELTQNSRRVDAAVLLKNASWESTAEARAELPDGLTDLADHNLFTFKSLWEPLDKPALLELTRHIVDYAKEQWGDVWSRSIRQTRPPIRACAVAMRTPQWLRPEQHFNQQRVAEGVFEFDTMMDLVIRIIIPKETEQIPRNALWHLLSMEAEQVEFGVKNYRRKNPQLYNFLNALLKFYGMEGYEMPYTVEDYEREAREEFLATASTEEILAARPPEELLKGLSPEQLLKGLSPEQLQALVKKLSEETS